jgi:hypothetical protein
MLIVDTQSPSGERVESGASLRASPSFDRVKKETDSQLRVTGSNAIASARLSYQSAKRMYFKRRIFSMRNFLLAGTAGLLVALSAAGVANAANPNAPSWSPYAAMGYQGDAPAMDPNDGRAAYVDPGYHRHRHAQPGYGYDADPDARNMNYDVNRPPGFGDTGSQF